MPSGRSAEGEEKVKVKVVVVPVPVPVPVFVPVPMNMYSQHTPVPLAMPVPVGVLTPDMLLGHNNEGVLKFLSVWFLFSQVPVPMVAPPLVKDVHDAAVQPEPLSASEEKAIQVPASTAGSLLLLILFILRRSEISVLSCLCCSDQLKATRLVLILEAQSQRPR